MARRRQVSRGRGPARAVPPSAATRPADRPVRLLHAVLATAVLGQAALLVQALWGGRPAVSAAPPVAAASAPVEYDTVLARIHTGALFGRESPAQGEVSTTAAHRLQGTLALGDGTGRALIDGQVVGEGGTMPGGLRIRTIEPYRVIAEHDGRRVELRFPDDWGLRGASLPAPSIEVSATEVPRAAPVARPRPTDYRDVQEWRRAVHEHERALRRGRAPS